MTALVAQRDAFGETMVELCDADDRVLLVDGDLANSTKSDRLARERPGRFFMLGIAEQNLIGVAAGLATLGLKPWVSSFAAFIATRDLDQIRVVVAQPRLNVRLAAHYSGILTGFTGKTHQAVNDLAIMRSLPNMAVVAPCDAVEVRAAMLALNDYEGPVYVRLTRDPAPIVLDSGYRFALGRAMCLKRGSDVALIATGSATARAMEAAALLEHAGIAALVLHVPSIKPLDEQAIVDAARSTRCVVTCEEHSVLGGLGGAVCETLSAHHPVRVARLGLPDVDAESGPNADLLDKYELGAGHIASAARALLDSL